MASQENTVATEDKTVAAEDEKTVQDWSCDDVLVWLKENKMEVLTPVFKQHEVSGMDLVLMTEEELRTMMGLSKLQAAKIVRLLETAEEAENEEKAEKANEEADAVAGKLEALGVVEGKPTPAVCAAEELTRSSSVRYGLPAGTAHIQLDDTCIARFTSGCEAITRLEAESVAQRLPGCREKLSQAQERVKLQSTKLQEMQEEYEKQEKAVEKLEDDKYYPGKLIMGILGKKEEKLEKSKQKLGSWEKKVGAGQEQLKNLQGDLSSAEKELAEVTSKVAQLEEARQFCASLLNSTFGGPTAGDARENALEREVDELGPKIYEVRRYKTVYGQALEMIVGARKALDQSAQMLNHAAGMARVDMLHSAIGPGRGRGGPLRPGRATTGGVMIDVVKRKQMAQGKALAATAADKAIRAREMVPDMPKVDVQKLKQMKMGLAVLDMAFSSVIVDAMVARKIQKALQDVQAAAADVRYAEHWLEGWIKGRIDQDLRSLEGQLAAKRKALHDVRVELLKKWIEAKAAREAAAVAKAADGAPAAKPPQQQVQGYFL